MILIIIASVLFSLALIVYVSLMVWDARHQVSKSPKTAMTLCDKHGAFPKEYTYKLDGMTPDPIEQCPFCFEDRFKEASQHYIQLQQKS